jgi:hypothetical protein
VSDYYEAGADIQLTHNGFSGVTGINPKTNNDPPDQPHPGSVISTGTEDYFDSGWHFNAGQFHMPVSGFTHLKTEKNLTEWSGYRFHEMDPLRFDDGLCVW